MLFQHLSVRVWAEYSGTWGKFPPGFKALSANGVLQRINDAIQEVMGSDFEGNDPTIALLYIFLEKGAPPEPIIAINLSSNYGKETDDERGYAEEELQDLLTELEAQVDEGTIAMYPYTEVGARVQSYSGLCFYPQLRADEVPIEDGRFIIALATTENRDVAAAVLGTVAAILKESVK